MVLSTLTWQEVRDLDRNAVCLLPTGSLEQHGPHLPLFTDSLLSTSVAQRAESRCSEESLLFPGIWLGCSAHHLAMPGTLTASAETYMRVLYEVIESASSHGFRKYLIVNGHGGNTEPNGLALRELKRRYPNHMLAHCGYFSLIPQTVLDENLKGPIKGIRHACEAETSMMMYLHPDLVRLERLRDDGLVMEPPAGEGVTFIQPFDEITEEGSFGYATLATPETGAALIEAAVQGIADAVRHMAAGYIMVSQGE